MSFLTGLQDLAVQGPGDSDSWGGPENGVDLIRHMGGETANAKAQRNPDVYMFFTIVGAVVVLWVLAGFVLKSAKAAV